MNHPAPILSTITTEVDAQTFTLVERLAEKRGINNAEFAAEAIRRVAESDADFEAFIQVGIDAADRGDVVPHEQVMAKLDGMIAEHRARCSK
ncbi:CopG family ribbon-helix-helix protein [Sphingomonas sp. Leaf357]|uniref:CopG family ribbon-helix-helix protein n=1 Tax=Sphingomonas sp. Leaf357 TaxID=1736350 RepID=UPI000AA824FF|nr:CopG family transcriptional regulator [Sphingomonas sp. Leaf357]